MVFQWRNREPTSLQDIIQETPFFVFLWILPGLFFFFFPNKWNELPAVLNQKDSLDRSEDGDGAYL